MPQFEDESSSSSEDDEEKSSSVNRVLPSYSSPQNKAAHRRHNHSDQENDNNDDDDHNNVPGGLKARQAGPAAVAATFQGEFKWDGVGDIQQLTNANATLAAQASKFKRQIKLYVGQHVRTRSVGVGCRLKRCVRRPFQLAGPAGSARSCTRVGPGSAPRAPARARREWRPCTFY